MLRTFTQKKNGRLYRYYVPYLHKRRNAGATLRPGAVDLGPLPAAEIEAAVLGQIHAALRAPEVLVATWRTCERHRRWMNLEWWSLCSASASYGRNCSLRSSSASRGY